MAPLTISNHLGLLQDDPDDVHAREALVQAFANGDRTVLGDEPLVRGVVHVGAERLGVVEVRDDREVEVARHEARIGPEAVGADLWNLPGERRERAFERGELRGTRFGSEAEQHHVPEDPVRCRH